MSWDEFLWEVESVGYEQVVGWENQEFRLLHPFYSDHAVRTFSGMYLWQKDVVAGSVRGKCFGRRFW